MTKYDWMDKKILSPWGETIPMGMKFYLIWRAYCAYEAGSMEHAFCGCQRAKNQGSLCSKSCQRLACLKYSLMLLFQYYVVICILPFLFLFLIHGSCTLRRVPLQEPRHTSNVCSIESLQDPCPEFGVSVEKIKKKIIVQRCLFSGSWSLCGHRFLKVSSQELRKHVQLSAAAM